ncbi:MAG: hypothetical protein KF689_12990 [Gemmatimonadaceae bacterium]|nr:hypothetical protein [Gemmatimonadaceae bacterium]MCW5827100.1 hypothetical protein [Gemmatimonadaceae bacterium]
MTAAKKKNTEVLGLSTEKAICNVAGVEPQGLERRIDSRLVRAVSPIVTLALVELPAVARHVGSELSAAGRQGKNPFDFKLAGGKTLSVKTNESRVSGKVCPPGIGQPGAKTYAKEFAELYQPADLNQAGHVLPQAFRRVAQERIVAKMTRYLDALLTCDYLLWLWLKPTPGYRVFRTSKLPKVDWNQGEFYFTQTPASWKEGCTVRYEPTAELGRISIGEFQIHKNRAGFKFRFKMKELVRLLDELK